MKWNNGTCQISNEMVANLEEVVGIGWYASVGSGEDYMDDIWLSETMPTEAAAKTAVAHWIGKTMAQFSNALAQGFEQPDDGC